MAWLTRPRAKHLELLARDHVRVERNCSRVAVVTEHQIFSSVPTHLHTLCDRAGKPDTFEHRVPPVTAAQSPHGVAARFSFTHFDNVNRVVGLEMFSHL